MAMQMTMTQSLRFTRSKNRTRMEARLRKSFVQDMPPQNWGIKEKLFIGVLTSRDTIDSLGVAINKTLTHYVPKLVFFMDTRGPSLPSGMAVVSFSDEKPYLRPFHMLKYLAAHYAQAYDYYMFIPDTTYVRGEKLLDMLSYISIRYDSILFHSHKRQHAFGPHEEIM